MAESRDPFQLLSTSKVHSFSSGECLSLSSIEEENESKSCQESIISYDGEWMKEISNDIVAEILDNQLFLHSKN